jgi:SPP1 gp7 family putative phage head morphogenesis protein
MENVELIQSIPAQYLERVGEVVEANLAAGRRYTEVTREIQAIGGITERRAKFIARDQVAKMNSDFNRIRQQDVGIKKYQWQTSNDERVRDSHEALNGLTFSWDEPPAVGHPGEDYLCRCVAAPLLDVDLPRAYGDPDVKPKDAEQTPAMVSAIAGYARAAAVSRIGSLVSVERKSARFLAGKQGGYDPEDFGLSPGKAGKVGYKDFAGKEIPDAWAAHAYTRSAGPINGFLRNGTKRGAAAFPKDAVPALVKGLDNTSGTMTLAQDAVVFRGAMLDQKRLDEILETIKRGKTYKDQDKAFISTSTRRKMALEWMPENASGKKVMLEIAAPRGTRGLSVKRVSHYPNEDEILLDRDTTLEIFDVRKDISGQIILRAMARQGKK